LLKSATPLTRAFHEKLLKIRVKRVANFNFCAKPIIQLKKNFASQAGEKDISRLRSKRYAIARIFFRFISALERL